MKTLLLIITLFITTTTFAQEQEAPLTIVEKMPQFKGGEGKMAKFIQKHVHYPQDALKAKMGGTCYVTFVVEKDGSLSGIKVLRGTKDCPQCDEEALNAVKAMPNWIPGEQNGNKVRTQYNLPIKFSPDK